MKKITLLFFMAIPFFMNAQQELDEKIVGGHNFIEIQMANRTLSLKKRQTTHRAVRLSSGSLAD